MSVRQFKIGAHRSTDEETKQGRTRQKEVGKSRWGTGEEAKWGNVRQYKAKQSVGVQCKRSAK